MNRLLYLGFAFPPGVSEFFPDKQPAGHLIETRMIESLGSSFEIRSVGVSDVDHTRLPWPLGKSPGLPHSLNLLDRSPELWHRYRSLSRLKAIWRRWQREGWQADSILVCNFSPIYNGFLRWLRHQPAAPPVILYLADSTTLRSSLSFSKRLRYQFKPLVWPDQQMLPLVHACVSTSRSVGEWFPQTGRPWLWLPNGIDANRMLRTRGRPETGPKRFGFFGALSDHTGITALLRVFTRKARDAELHICGFGRARQRLEAEFGGRPEVRFLGPLLPDDCVKFANSCDVLVNPRPVFQGNECNFSSKVFEYSLSGRPILTTRVSGVDAVLGEHAYYFDEHDFDRTLDNALDELIRMTRSELDQRGAQLQAHMERDWSWNRQGERLARFIRSCVQS